MASRTVTTLEQLETACQAAKDYTDDKLPVAATTSKDGLLTASDKTKLNAIEAGAQVNLIEAINLTGSGALSISDKTVTIPLATTAANGLMAAADKTKVNGMEAGSQVNIIETVALEGNTGTLTPSSKKVTIPLATTTANGLLSAAMLMKLQGIEEGAQKQPLMEYRQSNAWLFVRRDGKLVSNAIGPMNSEDLDKPSVIVERDGTTFTAHVYNSENGETAHELSDAEIFPFGCLKWYLNPDFSDSATECIKTSAGVANTSKTITISSWTAGDNVVCRLEY